MMTLEEAIKQITDMLNWYEIKRKDDDLTWGDDCDALKIALSALHPVSREQVERMRGEWKHYLPPLGAGNVQCRCTKCGRTPDVETPFCAWCGAPMTDEAVQMVMERLEALYEQ